MPGFNSWTPWGIGIHFNRPAVKIASRRCSAALYINEGRKHFWNSKKKASAWKTHSLLRGLKLCAAELFHFSGTFLIFPWWYYHSFEKKRKWKNIFLMGIPFLLSLQRWLQPQGAPGFCGASWVCGPQPRPSLKVSSMVNSSARPETWSWWLYTL